MIPVLLMARELHLGGSERQMTEIAKALDRSQFEPHVGCFLSAGMRGDELRSAGVKIVEFPIRSYKSPSALTGLLTFARYIRRNKIRLVHTWDYPTTAFLIAATRLLTSAVALSSQRGERTLTPDNYLRLVHWSDRLAHAIVVNCNFLERHLIDDGVPEGKIRLCRNGIDTRHFTRIEGPKPEVLKGSSVVIGTVCSLRPEKDLGTLIDAFASIHATAPGSKLVIVGSGPELGDLQSRARAARIEHACHFEPGTPRVPEWLSAMDIFVLPSRTEALSNALMEAMSCGCCAAASDVGGNPELIRDGVTGLLFPPGDLKALAAVLQRLISDAELRRALAGQGCRFVREELSLEAAARRMRDVYCEMLRL